MKTKQTNTVEGNEGSKPSLFKRDQSACDNKLWVVFLSNHFKLQKKQTKKQNTASSVSCLEAVVCTYSALRC